MGHIELSNQLLNGLIENYNLIRQHLEESGPDYRLTLGEQKRLLDIVEMRAQDFVWGQSAMTNTAGVIAGVPGAAADATAGIGTFGYYFITAGFPAAYGMGKAASNGMYAAYDEVSVSKGEKAFKSFFKAADGETLDELAYLIQNFEHLKIDPRHVSGIYDAQQRVLTEMGADGSASAVELSDLKKWLNDLGLDGDAYEKLKNRDISEYLQTRENTFSVEIQRNLSSLEDIFDLVRSQNKNFPSFSELKFRNYTHRAYQDINGNWPELGEVEKISNRIAFSDVSIELVSFSHDRTAKYTGSKRILNDTLQELKDEIRDNIEVRNSVSIEANENGTNNITLSREIKSGSRDMDWLNVNDFLKPENGAIDYAPSYEDVRDGLIAENDSIKDIDDLIAQVGIDFIRNFREAVEDINGNYKNRVIEFTKLSDHSDVIEGLLEFNGYEGVKVGLNSEGTELIIENFPGDYDALITAIDLAVEERREVYNIFTRMDIEERQELQVDSHRQWRPAHDFVQDQNNDGMNDYDYVKGAVMAFLDNPDDPDARNEAILAELLPITDFSISDYQGQDSDKNFVTAGPNRLTVSNDPTG